METETNFSQHNKNIRKDINKSQTYSKCDQHPNTYNSTHPTMESRIPLPAMFEEEGTQTENSTNEFLYEDPDNDVQQGQTRIEITDMNRSQMDPQSRLQDIDSTSPSSNQIIFRGSSNEGHVPCNLISSSSNNSDSGDSVIERLSKSVSRLLKPVSVNPFLYNMQCIMRIIVYDSYINYLFILGVTEKQS